MSKEYRVSMPTLSLPVLCFMAAMLFSPPALSADEFDTLRLKWREMLTLGTNANPADPNYAGWISSIGREAQNDWASMNTNAGRTFLWSDLNHLGTVSADITETHGRIKAMALGYAVHGSSVEANATLRNAIIGALDWMYAGYYNETKTEYDNWYDWEIGTPLELNDVAVLMYDDLTGAQLDNYMRAINRFTPAPEGTGANLVWKASVVAVHGVLVRSGAELAAARDSLSNVFPYVTSGDGFYPDGSFVFHSIFPYNGSYGNQLLGTLGLLMQFLAGSSWAVADPQQTNLFRWVYDAFEPFLYRGAMMQMTSGRVYTRVGDDHRDGHDVMASILRLAQFAPPADAAAYKRMIKYWCQADAHRDFIGNQPPPLNVWANAVLNDPGVLPRGELVRHCQFPRMDRVAHLRPGWGFGLALSSSRIGNYESIRNENLRGWYTGDGMTYLYNNDLGYYADGFWPTVDPYRLPGTTVDTQPRAEGSGQGCLSPNNWVGGASLQNLYGVSGMQLKAWNSSLTAKKSWFMFDDEVVCLGAGITGTDSRPIETIVENRKLTSYGNNPFTVNGVAQNPAPGWAESMTNVSWAHLCGNVPGADIGFYFPQPAAVSARRETRAGSLADLNLTYGSTNLVTRHFLTLWFDHGPNPSNAAYAYVLLPNQTAPQVASYAANPEILVLENSPRAQGVRETTLGLTAVNFWNAGANSLGGITVDRKSSVILQNDGTYLELGISDPTQTNAGLINVEINAAASATLAVEPGITVVRLSPTIQLAVNVGGAAGRALHARFFVGLVQTFTLPPAADAYVENGSKTNSNFGTNVLLIVKPSSSSLARETYLRFDLAPGFLLDATLRLVPITVNTPLQHVLAFVPDNSWTETGITWNNKPTSDPEFTRWLLPAAGTPVLLPVTPLAQQAMAADGKLSLRIYGVTNPPAGNIYAEYASGEHSRITNRPQLLVTLGRIPPSVVLTSQPNDTVFDAPAAVTLVADAQDADGNITEVAFYNGAARCAQFTTPSCTLALTNLAAGQYTFTAVATDNTGLISTSAPVSFSVFNPQPAGRGAGLIGDYFTNQNLAGLVLTRTDSRVNFFWGTAAPYPSIPADHFSVRWTGKLQARHAGLHTFSTVSDEGVRLWVDNQLLIDNWIGHTAAEDAGALVLLPGRYYDLRMEYYDNTGSATAKLYWTQPGGSKELIPQSQLYPADVGLRGDYFAGANFTGLAFSRIDDTVDFSWGNSSPGPGLAAGAFSVRWSGKVRAGQGGAYTFHTLNNGSVNLWVNNQLVISNRTGQAAAENSGAITLGAGQYCSLTLEYAANSGNPTVVLMWTPPGEARQVIPAADLTSHQNNNPPVLEAIPNRAVVPGCLLSFPVATSDPDLPTQSLTFSLEPGAPSGAAIQPATGLFTWAPAPTQPLGNYSVTVRVTDNGTPALTDAQTITIAVLSQPLLGIAVSGDNAELRWPLDAGWFQLYTATDLTPPVRWIRSDNVPVPANGQWIVRLPVTTNRTQFYRLQTQ